MFLGQAPMMGQPTVQMSGQQMVMLSGPAMGQAQAAQQPVQYIFQPTGQPTMTQAQVPLQANLQMANQQRGIVQNAMTTPFGMQAQQPQQQAIQLQNFAQPQLQQTAPIQFMNTANNMNVPQTFLLNTQPQIQCQPQMQPQQQQIQLHPQQAQIQLQAQLQPQQFAIQQPQMQPQPQQQMVQYMLPNGQIVQALQQATPTPQAIQLQPQPQFNQIQQLSQPQVQTQFFATPTQTFFQAQPQTQTATFITSPNGTQQFIQTSDQPQQLLLSTGGQSTTTLISPQQMAGQTQMTAPQQFLFQPDPNSSQPQQMNHVIQSQNSQPLLMQACSQSPVMLLATNTSNPGNVAQTMSPVIMSKNQLSAINPSSQQQMQQQQQHQQISVPTMISIENNNTISQAKKDNSSRQICQITPLPQKMASKLANKQWNAPKVPQKQPVVQSPPEQTFEPEQETEQDQSPEVTNERDNESKDGMNEEEGEEETEQNDGGAEEGEQNSDQEIAYSSPETECANEQSTQCDNIPGEYMEGDETDENHNRTKSDSECEGSLKTICNQQSSQSEEEAGENSSSPFSGTTEIQCSPEKEAEVEEGDEQEVGKEESETGGDSCRFTDSDCDSDDDKESKNADTQAQGNIKMLTKNGLSKAAYELIDNKLLDEDSSKGSAKQNPQENEENENVENESKESNSVFSYPQSSPGSVGGSSVNSQNQESSNKLHETHISNLKEQFYKGIDIDELREFARRFKLYRQKLDLTQSQVGSDLGKLVGLSQSYSQSAICRFENLDVTPKSALKLRPVLENWIKMSKIKYKAAQENLSGKDNSGDFKDHLAKRLLRGCDQNDNDSGKNKIDLMFDEIDDKFDLTDFAYFDPGKKRKKRTSFQPMVVQQLENHFKTNPKPSGEELNRIANALNFERDVIRVWFCNRRQKQANTLRTKKEKSEDEQDSKEPPTKLAKTPTNTDIKNEEKNMPRFPQIPTMPAPLYYPTGKDGPMPANGRFPVPMPQNAFPMTSVYNSSFGPFPKGIQTGGFNSKNQLLPPPPFGVQKNILGDRFSTFIPMPAGMYKKN